MLKTFEYYVIIKRARYDYQYDKTLSSFKIGVFDSVSRGEETENSDIDIAYLNLRWHWIF